MEKKTVEKPIKLHPKTDWIYTCFSFEKRVEELENRIEKLEAKTPNETTEILKRMIGMISDGITQSPGIINFLEGTRETDIDKLNKEIKKLKNDTKITELKAITDKLKESIKDREPSREIEPKEIFQMLLQDKKRTDEFKDMVRTKDTKLLKQSMENQSKIFAERLEDLKNKPRVVDQIREIQETTNTLKNMGFWSNNLDERLKECIDKIVEQMMVKKLADKWFGRN